MKRAAVAVALALVAAACGPKNYVVLLDNPGGGSGKVIVATGEGKQVLDKSGHATTINRADKPPSTPWQVGVDKIREVFGRAFGARPSRFVRYTIYFKPNSLEFEPVSGPRLRAMIEEVRRRPGVDATVAGHADRTDTEERNYEMGLYRAKKVRAILIEAGIPSYRIEAVSYGESLPVIPTDDEVPELRNRRVEVTIR